MSVTPTSSADEKIRKKILQIYKFLRQLHLVRHPVPLRLADQPFTLPIGPTANPYIKYESADADAAGDTDDDSGSIILRVTRPDLLEPPSPPDEISDWIDGDWRSSASDVSAHQARTLDENEERFEANDQRVDLFQAWHRRWTAWRSDDVIARAGMQYFDSLYRLHNELQREAEQFDLLVGDGRLAWSRAGDDDIDHPILLKPVELRFNPDVPEFLVVNTPQATQLYEALLSKVPVADPSLVSETRRELESTEIHPLSGASVDEFLQRFIVRLSSEGRFFREAAPASSKSPAISRASVLLTRKRTLDYASAIDAVIEKIEKGAPVPDFLSRVVGDQLQPEVEPAVSHPAIDTNGADEEVLLTKAANAEQLEIARRLKRSGGVVVQGPPGTGKTHTIANLIGHLLASGYRILVTSHTSKALEVVRDQIAPPLQALCVSVLGADARSRAQMESAINAITGHLGSAESMSNAADEAALSRERSTVLRQLKAAQDDLIRARRDEYTDIQIAGSTFAPSDAARYVRENAGADGWLPGPIRGFEPPPLSGAEIERLYSLNEIVAPEDEREFELRRPRLAELPSFDEFKSACDDLALLAEHSANPRFWNTPESESDAELVMKAIESFESAVAVASNVGAWEAGALRAGMVGGGHLDIWNELLQLVKQVQGFADGHASLGASHEPTVTEEQLDSILPTLEEIATYWRSKRKAPGPLVKLFNSSWRRAFEACSVRGVTPSEIEHIEALISHVTLEKMRKELRRRWAVVTGGSGTDISSSADPERIAAQLVPRITLLLRWHTTEFEPARMLLLTQGLQWDLILAAIEPDVSEHGEIRRLTSALPELLRPEAIAEYKRRRRVAIMKMLDATEGVLADGMGKRNSSHLWSALQRAVRDRDPVGYATHLRELHRLESLESCASERRELLQRLSTAAAEWSAQIEKRRPPHDGATAPGDVTKAWLWQQLRQELTRRSSVSLSKLVEDISRLTERFRDLTADVAERRAWAHLLSSTTSPQRSALQAYKNAVKMFGSGKGKRANRFAKLAQEQMQLSQGAVPAWVMPLSRVYTTYRDVNAFDILIIDEASQADIYALLAMSFAKHVIVVGDDEQVTPERPGTEIARVDHLIDTFLEGVPKKELFIEESSIFDFAKVAFGAPVVLTEHFRCVEPIIRFSNNLSYNGVIKPLRDSSDVRIKPATVEAHVNDGVSKEQLNIEEGRYVASLICAMLERKEYEGATFGVVALSGQKQAMYIETLLRRHIDPREMEARKIQCGMPPQFQGDQRDVMLLSVVDSPDEHGTSRDPGYGPRDRTKKRFNVAASRARDQMWVCHSLDPHKLKAEDLRRRLILHARNPESTEILKEEARQRAESPFETLVQAALIERGYRVIPQYQVGSYRIDMLVTDGERTLAVECDGDRYHTLETLERDVTRQMILERCGYRFERIRGSLFFSDPNSALEPVFKRIAALDIKPRASESIPEARDGSELRDAVLTRAAEIREEWANQPEERVPEAGGRTKKWGKPFTARAKAGATEDAASMSGISKEANAETLKSAAVIVAPDPSNNGTVAASASDIGVPLVERLREAALVFIDNREQGGNLWVVGDSTLSQYFEILRGEGIRFIFSEDGGRATGYRPGWFTTSRS